MLQATVSRTAVGHDPVPDGRSGPWNRSPHHRSAAGLTWDHRCGRCQWLAEALGMCPRSDLPVVAIEAMVER